MPTSPRRLDTDATTAAALHQLGHVTVVLDRLDGPVWRYHRPSHTLYIDERADVVVAIREALADLIDGTPALRCIDGGRDDQCVGR